jgi:hypothetical protein
VLAIIAGDAGLPDSSVSTYSLKHDAEKSGLTAIGFALAFRRLVTKRFVELFDDFDFNGNSYGAARLTANGWDFIENNESLFVLKRSRSTDTSDDIPF